MAKKKSAAPSFDEFIQKLRSMQFQVSDAGGGKFFAMKNGCAAGIQRESDGKISYFSPPGRVVRGELARLIDRGYQKFLKTADWEVPALSEDLKAIARFIRELKFAAGVPVLYNEGLGSVSDRYLYDRIWYRDEGKQPKAWQMPITPEP